MLEQDILSHLPNLLILTSYKLICTNIYNRYRKCTELLLPVV